MSSGKSQLSTRFFYDGSELHDNVLLTFDDDGTLTRVSQSTARHDHFLVSTGLVDIQMNGYDSIDVADLDRDTLPELGTTLRSLGTLSWLATLVSAPLSHMSTRVAKVTELLEGTEPREYELTHRANSGVVQSRSGCAGIHLEGPFLGSATGAHNADHVVSAEIEWIESLPRSVRMMTIAPDNPSCIAAIGALRARNIAVSLGHSRPTHDQFESAVDAGASSITHLFNAMSGVHHRDGGLANWAIVDDRLAKGLIADGVHVADAAGVLAGRAIPPDMRYLVSDSIAWNGKWAKGGQVAIRDGAPRLPDGTLAGSSTSLARCVGNAVRAWNWPLRDALRSATCIPARVAGISAPEVSVGRRTTLVCWDETLAVTGIIDN